MARARSRGPWLAVGLAGIAGVLATARYFNTVGQNVGIFALPLEREVDSTGLIAIVVSFFALHADGVPRRRRPAPHTSRSASGAGGIVAALLSLSARRPDRQAERDGRAVDPAHRLGGQFCLRHAAVRDRSVQESGYRRHRRPDCGHHFRAAVDAGRRRPGLARAFSASPCRSTSRCRPIRIWPWASDGCSASGCPKTSSGRTWPAPSTSSGRNGSRRSGSGSATTCACRSAAARWVSCCWRLPWPASGTARAGRS